MEGENDTLASMDVGLGWNRKEARTRKRIRQSMERDGTCASRDACTYWMSISNLETQYVLTV
eukprot:4250065-Pyramimonas_sp.AAC.1